MVGWVTAEGAVLERCVTRRMAVTPSKDVYIASIAPEAAALLLAKKVVHEAQRSGAAADRGRSERIRTAIGAPGALMTVPMLAHCRLHFMQ